MPFFEKVLNSIQSTYATISLYVFTAAYVVIARIDLSLDHFDGRIISEATLHGALDIEKRVKVYILAVIFSTILFFALGALHAAWNSYLSKQTWKKIHTVSLVSIFFIVVNLLVLRTETIGYLPIVLAIQLCLAIADRTVSSVDFTTGYFGVLLVISLNIASGFFIIYDDIIASNVRIALSISAVLLLLQLSVSAIIAKQRVAVDRILTTLLPLTLIIPTYFLSTELTFLLSRKTSLSITGLQIYGGGILILCALSLTLLRTKKAMTSHAAATYIAYPALIIGAGIIAGYSPIKTVELVNHFEPANPGLAIQQWTSFGKLPYVHTFNAHGLYDSLWGFLYTLVHGVIDTGWQFYDFFQRIVELLLAYALIYIVTRRSDISILAVCCVPFMWYIFPTILTVSIGALLLLLYIQDSRSLRTWTLYWLGMIALCFWSIDTGLFTAVSSAIFIIFLAIQHRDYGQIKTHITAGLLASAITATVVSMVLTVYGIPILARLEEVKHILSSNQTFGHIKLFRNFSTQTVLGYIVMPATILCLNVYLFAKNYSQKKQVPLFQKVILYLSVFYFLVLVRGVVRQTLLTGKIWYVHSFAFAIFGFAMYGILKTKNTLRVAITSIAMMCACALVFTSIEYPYNTPSNVTKHSLMTVAAERLITVPTFSTINETSLKDRGSLLAKDQDFYDDFSAFIDANLTEEQTFYDYSTNPMLYYFADRMNPIYVNHDILMHDELLQRVALDQISEFDIPVLVFSNVDGAHPYNLDGVQFFWRYFRMSEYFYQHYSPAYVVDQKEIWFRNDWEPSDTSMFKKQKDVSLIEESLVEYRTNMKVVPYLWATYGNVNYSSIRTVAEFENEEALTARPGFPVYWELPREISDEDKTDGNYIYIKGRSLSGKKLTVRTDFGQAPDNYSWTTFTTQTDANSHEYLIRVSAQYPWYRLAISSIRIGSPDGPFEIEEVRIYTAD